MTPAGRRETWPMGGGAMGALIRDHDWGVTPLGPRADWPVGLRAAVDLVLGCAFPMIILWGADLTQVYNDGYRGMLGDKHPGGLGQPTRECWPEVWHLNAPIYARVQNGETVTLADSLYPITRHGYLEDAYFTLCYSPLHDEMGAVAGILVTVFETTAAVRARTLEAEQSRLTAALAGTQSDLLADIFRLSPSFLHVLYGPDFIFELVNDAYYQLVGHRPLLGQPAFAALPEAGDGGFQKRIARVMVTGEPFVGRELPITLARTPGAPPEERLIDLIYVSLIDANGGRTRVLGHGVDVTEQVRARQQTEMERDRLLAAERAARVEAEEAVQARDTFLSIAAHELRTPLTTLKGAAQLLLRRQARGLLDPERLVASLEDLNRASGRLAALTDDLLDVARIRTGQLPLNLSPTDLVALAEEAVDRQRDQATEGHLVRLATEPGLPTVLADAGRVEQVLTNLLDNAVKYSPSGGEIVIMLWAADTGVVIAVRDTGIGLPPGTDEAIFEPFGRAANAGASQLPGMGLGLYICRDIVERHGGWMRAVSAGEGAGTTVSFWLPSVGPSDGAEA